MLLVLIAAAAAVYADAVSAHAVVVVVSWFSLSFCPCVGYLVSCSLYDHLVGRVPACVVLCVNGIVPALSLWKTRT